LTNGYNVLPPELSQKNITISTLYLPLVKTRMISPTKAYENAPAMQPEQVAAVIAKTIYKKIKNFLYLGGHIRLPY
jgi:short-subunit dehydrogenase